MSYKNFFLDLSYAVKKAFLKDRISFLKKTLRNYPEWPSGHLAYALENIAKLKSADAKDLRKISALKVSASAILSLSKNNKFDSEAKFITAMSHFYEKDYEHALRAFTSLLSGEQVNDLSDFSYKTAIEYAGLSAMTLEQEDLAQKYFAMMP